MIIDTAPFFLGFFAYLIGQRQERNENINKELMSSLEELHKMQNQLLEQERLRSEIALSSQIAHELKNPLNFIINYTEISMELLRECAIPEGSGPMYEDLNGIKKNISDNLMVIHKHGKRSGSILSELLKAQHAAA
jgi:signal transduction histidine kinase